MFGRTISPAKLDPMFVWYLGYNQALFQGELPNDILMDHDLKDDTKIAMTEIFYVNGTRYYRITFNQKFNLAGNQERMSELHEMCHVRLYVEEQYELDDHGPKFQSCMHDVANKRGFDPIW